MENQRRQPDAAGAAYAYAYADGRRPTADASCCYQRPATGDGRRSRR